MEKNQTPLLNVSLDTSSKWQHNKMIVFLEKILVKFSFVFCLKRGGGSDNKCHLKIEVSLVSCFQ